MLAYLDALLAARATGREDELQRLLMQPMAGILPHDVLMELRSGTPAARRRVPLNMLQLRHRVVQLVADRDPANRGARRSAPVAQRGRPSPTRSKATLISG